MQMLCMRAVHTARFGKFTRHLSAFAILGGLVAGAPVFAQDAPLASLLPDATRQAGVITVVGDNFPPYRIVADDGKTVTGLETDLLDAMAPLLGVKFEQTIVAGLPAMLAGIETDRYQLSSGPLLATPDREARYDIIPWVLSKPALIFKADAADRIKVLDDACGLKLSFSAGSASERTQQQIAERCVAHGKPAPVDVPLPDKDALMLSIQSGRADATHGQLSVGLYLQFQKPGEYHLLTDETDELGILNLGMVLKHDSPLSAAIAAALTALRESGEYQKILDKYGLGAAAQTEFVVNPNSR